MAVHTADLYGVARLAVELAVAVDVLRVVAVDALHPLFKVDVFEMHRLAERIAGVGQQVAVLIEQVTMAVALVDRAEDPAVGVEVSELRVLQIGVEGGRADLLEELRVAPVAARRRALRVAHGDIMLLLQARIVLYRGIHLLAVGLVVPPGVAVVGGDHVRAGMDMAGHALAGGNLFGEDVLQRMPALTLVDSGVVADAAAGVAEGRGLRAVAGIAVVGVEHVAGRAAAGAVVAGLVVGAGKAQQRVEQARLLQAEEDGVSPQVGTQSAVGELEVRLSGGLVGVRVADLAALFAAALKDAQHVAGLGELPAL